MTPPSHPAASASSLRREAPWKISRYSFDGKLKAARGTEEPIGVLFFFKKKIKVLGGGEGREGTQKGLILTSLQPRDDPFSFCA